MWMPEDYGREKEVWHVGEVRVGRDDELGVGWYISNVLIFKMVSEIILGKRVCC